jgi:hypothetical protein
MLGTTSSGPPNRHLFVRASILFNLLKPVEDPLHRHKGLSSNFSAWHLYFYFDRRSIESRTAIQITLAENAPFAGKCDSQTDGASYSKITIMAQSSGLNGFALAGFKTAAKSSTPDVNINRLPTP